MPPEAQLTVAIRDENGQTRVGCSGEIDLYTHELLKMHLDNPPPLKGEGIIDLTRTEHLDAAGFRIIRTFAHRVKEAGKNIKILALAKSIVHRIFELTGFHREFPIEYQDSH